MSCHNIGRGMNYVVKNVIKMYDTGELTLEAARKIIAAARRGGVMEMSTKQLKSYAGAAVGDV